MPILHNRSNNLSTRRLTLGPDGQEAVFASLDLRKHVGEGFAAEEADRCHERISGGDRRLCDSKRASAFFDGVEWSLKVRVRGFGAKQTEYLVGGF